MIHFFARVVELREEKTVKYDGKITANLPSREFLEMPFYHCITLFRFLQVFFYVQSQAIYYFGENCKRSRKDVLP